MLMQLFFRLTLYKFILTSITTHGSDLLAILKLEEHFCVLQVFFIARHKLIILALEYSF